MAKLKVQYLALATIMVVGLVGCNNSDASIKPEDSVGSDLAKAKKDGAVAPDAGKTKSLKRDTDAQKATEASNSNAPAPN